jgi:hypothetical protein
MRAPEGRPNDLGADTGPENGLGNDPESGSDVSVLATAPDEWSGPALRLGARVFPLRRWMARAHGTVGAEVAVTASLLGRLPTGPTAVIVVAPDVAVASVVDQALPAAHGMLTGGRAAAGSLTLGVASPGPVRSGTAGRLAMFNQHLDALPEALVECVAAARRCGLVTAQGNCVLLLQRFVPATASAVVHASPDRRRPVHVDGRWGLTETSTPADTFEVPVDGAISEKLAWKPTAHLVAHGGTHTVKLPPGYRDRYSLRLGAVRALAALSRDAAVTAGRALSLDVALAPRGPVVLRCRPTRE